MTGFSANLQAQYHQEDLQRLRGFRPIDDTFIPIVNGGKQWYNIHGKIHVILDDTDTITLVYRSRHTEEERLITDACSANTGRNSCVR